MKEFNTREFGRVLLEKVYEVMESVVEEMKKVCDLHVQLPFGNKIALHDTVSSYSVSVSFKENSSESTLLSVSISDDDVKDVPILVIGAYSRDRAKTYKLAELAEPFRNVFQKAMSKYLMTFQRPQVSYKCIRMEGVHTRDYGYFQQYGEDLLLLYNNFVADGLVGMSTGDVAEAIRQSYDLHNAAVMDGDVIVIGEPGSKNANAYFLDKVTWRADSAFGVFVVNCEYREIPMGQYDALTAGNADYVCFIDGNGIRKLEEVDINQSFMAVVEPYMDNMFRIAELVNYETHLLVGVYSSYAEAKRVISSIIEDRKKLPYYKEMHRQFSAVAYKELGKIAERRYAKRFAC